MKAGAGTVVLSGPGIHTGAPCRVEIRRRDSEPAAEAGGAGIRFLLRGKVLVPSDLARLPRQSRRATVVGIEGGGLHTPEHLLAALLFFAEEPLDIRLEGGEVPNLDGSALPFREALSSVAASKSIAAAPTSRRWREYPSGLRWEHRWEGGHIAVRPAGRFAVEWTLARGSLAEKVRVESPQEAWDQVLPARTWIFHAEWQKAREAGLVRGGGSESGLLLAASVEEHRALRAAHPDWRGGPHPLLNQVAWRMDGEPARHKVLDLLGDLALLGLGLPALEIEVRNGGHSINHLLLEKLIHG